MKHMLNQPTFYVGVICLLISYGIDQAARIWITEESEGAASPWAFMEAFVEYADVQPSQKPKSTCAILQIPRENEQKDLQLKFCPPPQMTEEEKEEAEKEKAANASIKQNLTIASVFFTGVGIILLAFAFWRAKNDHQAEQQKADSVKNEKQQGGGRSGRASSVSSMRGSDIKTPLHNQNIPMSDTTVSGENPAYEVPQKVRQEGSINTPGE